MILLKLICFREIGNTLKLDMGTASLLLALLASGGLAAERSSLDACDAEDTALSHLADPLLLPGCERSFHHEDELLESSCLHDTATALAADGSAAACAALRKQWFRAARAIEKAQWLTSATERARVRSFAQAFRSGAAEIVALVLRGGSGVENTVIPAIQWAQNQSSVAVLVRYSPKKHGPVSVASVEEPEISLSSTSIAFKGLGRPNSSAFCMC